MPYQYYRKYVPPKRPRTQRVVLGGGGGGGRKKSGGAGLGIAIAGLGIGAAALIGYFALTNAKGTSPTQVCTPGALQGQTTCSDGSLAGGQICNTAGTAWGAYSPASCPAACTSGDYQNATLCSDGKTYIGGQECVSGAWVTNPVTNCPVSEICTPGTLSGQTTCSNGSLAGGSVCNSTGTAWTPYSPATCPACACTQGAYQGGTLCSDGVTYAGGQECENCAWVTNPVTTCPVTQVCTPGALQGQTTCVGGTLAGGQVCNSAGTAWGAYSPATCPACTVGTTECVGGTLYNCPSGQWTSMGIPCATGDSSIIYQSGSTTYLANSSGTVIDSGDADLAAAVAAAVSNGISSSIYVGTGTYYLGSNLSLPTNCALVGEGTSLVQVTSGDYDIEMFYSNTTLSGMYFAGGPELMIQTANGASLSNINVTSVTIDPPGGSGRYGVYFEADSGLSISGLSMNNVIVNGGDLSGFVYGGQVGTLANSTFTSCQANNCGVSDSVSSNYAVGYYMVGQQNNVQYISCLAAGNYNSGFMIYDATPLFTNVVLTNCIANNNGVCACSGTRPQVGFWTSSTVTNTNPTGTGNYGGLTAVWAA